MNISKLMQLSEASGFVTAGATNAVDSYPEMSVVECQAALSAYISESVIEQHEATRAHNNAIVESIVNAMTNGSAIDESATAALSEGAWESIKKHVSAFFAKIKKFIDTIIAKLKVLIDRMTMNGKQLYQKYKNDPDLKKNAGRLDGLTFEGFKIADVDFKYQSFMTDGGAEKLILAAYKGTTITTPLDFRAKFFKKRYSDSKETELMKDDDEYTEEMNSALEPFEKLNTKERVANMVSELTGISGLGEDWAKEIREKIYESHTFTYGKDGFDVASCGAILENPKKMSEIRASYINLRKAVERDEKELNQLSANETNASSKLEENNPSRRISTVYTSYINKYLAAYKDAVSVINNVSRIHQAYEENKFNQARKMFSKILGTVKKGFKSDDEKKDTGKKSDNNDVEIDDELMFEL